MHAGFHVSVVFGNSSHCSSRPNAAVAKLVVNSPKVPSIYFSTDNLSFSIVHILHREVYLDLVCLKQFKSG